MPAKIRALLAGALLACSSVNAQVDTNVTFPHYDKAQVHCLARALYHEARGETKKGQHAVAAVVFNRTKHPQFPDNVCQVLKQRMQFPWWPKRTPTQSEEFQRAFQTAKMLTIFYNSGFTEWKPKEVRHALYFNTVPFKGLKHVGTIGGHLFYTNHPKQL